MRATDEDAVDVYDGVLGMGLAAGELVTLLDAEDVLDLREGEEGLQGVVGAFVTYGRDDGLLRADDGAGVVAKFLDLSNYFVDLLAGRMGTDDDDHETGQCSDSGVGCRVLRGPNRLNFLWLRGCGP
jgi:hypothetical protein